MLAGTLHAIPHQSQVLKNNPLGDPSRRELLVYTPPSYGLPGRRFPVIYCLAAFTSTGRSLVNHTPFQPGLPQRFEALLRAGLPECILVFPDCYTRVGGSQYVDSTATGRYETYMMDEIIPFVDKHFHTIPSGDARAVMGKSSGGFGALHLCLSRPGVFGACYSHSGDLYFEYGYKPELPRFWTGFRKHGSIRAFLDYFDAQPVKRGGDVAVLNVIGMAACYSPNPDNPDMGIELPIDLDTGELLAEVWERWVAFDPVTRLASQGKALAGLRGLYLDCGLRDEYGLQCGARIFSSRLKSLAIPHSHEEFEDGHMGTSYRYDVSLRALATLLSET